MASLISDPILAAFHAAWEPPDLRPIVEWAAENIDLPLAYAIPGPFHAEKSRHILKVFEALEDDTRRMVNVLKATQTFGTGIADIWIPWTLDNCAGPTMSNWHTDQMAGQHAETRLMAVIKNCKRLQRLMPDDRSAKRKQEIIFKNGVPLFIQGPSEGNLQGKSIRFQHNDEVWQWKPGRHREAMARLTQYKKIGTSKILNISQGGTVKDDWHKLTEDGDMFEWEVACPHCDGFQILCMEARDKDNKKIYRMKWDKDGENIYYECEHCLKHIFDTDAQRAAFNATGRYRQTRVGRDRETVTFRWTSLIWLPWRDLVKEYRECLAAKKVGALLPLKAFLQKVLAQFWDEKEQIEMKNILIRYADYLPCKFPPGFNVLAGDRGQVGSAECGVRNEDADREGADQLHGPSGLAPARVLPWADEKFRFMTVDCQANFLEFWVVIRAWGANESRRLWRGRVTSWEAVRQLQLDWNVRSQFVAVDSGYRASEVYRQCCRYVDETGRGWVALKGSPAESFTHTFKDKPSEKRIYSERQFGDPMLGLKNMDVEKWLAGVSPHGLEIYRRGKLKCPLYLWSNPSVKDITSNLRDGQGLPWLAPASEQRSMEEHIYRQQMASEPKVLEHDARGGEKWVYHQVGDNHIWDCENEQTFCALVSGVIPLPAVA